MLLPVYTVLHYALDGRGRHLCSCAVDFNRRVRWCCIDVFSVPPPVHQSAVPGQHLPHGSPSAHARTRCIVCVRDNINCSAQVQFICFYYYYSLRLLWKCGQHSRRRSVISFSSFRNSFEYEIEGTNIPTAPCSRCVFVFFFILTVLIVRFVSVVSPQRNGRFRGIP